MIDLEIYPGTTARALPSHRTYKVILQANPNNSGTIRVGGAGSQSVRLQAGWDYTYEDVKNSSEIYVRAENTTDKVAVHIYD